MKGGRNMGVRGLAEGRKREEHGGARDTQCSSRVWGLALRTERGKAGNIVSVWDRVLTEMRSCPGTERRGLAMPRHEHCEGRGAPGFTLVEVLVAVVVAASVFLAFFGVQALGVRTRAHARFASSALDHAADFLDQVSVSEGEVIVVDGEAVADSGFVEKPIDKKSGPVFSRRWDIEKGIPGPHLWTVRVLVCWREPRKPPPSAEHCRFPEPAAPHVGLEGVVYRP